MFDRHRRAIATIGYRTIHPPEPLGIARHPSRFLLRDPQKKGDETNERITHKLHTLGIFQKLGV